jgi:hypothetical protein
MGKDSPKPPPAPDPREVAGAQYEYNKEAAIDQRLLNAYNEITPYGTIEYGPIGTTGPQMRVPPSAPSQPTATTQPVEQLQAGPQPSRYEGMDYRTFRENLPSLMMDIDWEAQGPEQGIAATPQRLATSGAETTPGGGDIERWERRVTLTPEQQESLETQQDITGELYGTAQDLLGNLRGTYNPDTGQYEGGALGYSADDLMAVLKDPSKVTQRITDIDTSGMQDYVAGIQGGPIQQAIGPTGQIAMGLDEGGQIKGQLDRSRFGDISQQVAGAEQMGRQVAPSGQVQMGIGAQGPIARTIADVGGPQRGLQGYGDIGQARNRSEQALFERISSRVEPQLQMNRQRIEQQLSDRGIVQGSPAYQQAMDQLSRQETDTRQAAVNEAIMGGGQEMSRQFGVDLSAGQFGNQAQQQAFQQAALRGDFGNQAQQQAYNQALSSGQFANIAQGQQFGQNVAQAQMANQARQQDFENRLSQQTFENTAQAQQFAQEMAATGVMNNAQLQEFNQMVTQGQFQNAAQAQDYLQQVGNATFANQAQAQQFGQGQQNAALANLVRGQQFGEAVGQANLANVANLQDIQNLSYIRNLPLNDIAALLGTGQIQGPQYGATPTGTINPADFTGPAYASYQGQMGQYNAQQQADAAKSGAMWGLGGTALSAFAPGGGNLVSLFQ